MSRGAEDGVDRIAFSSGEVVSFQMPVFLEMSDDRLDPCPAVECAAFDERDIDAGNGCSGEAGHLIDLSGKAVSVIGITGQRHGTEDKLTALAALVGGGDGRLAAELIAGARLALAPSRACSHALPGSGYSPLRARAWRRVE